MIIIAAAIIAAAILVASYFDKPTLIDISVGHHIHGRRLPSVDHPFTGTEPSDMDTHFSDLCAQVASLPGLYAADKAQAVADAVAANTAQLNAVADATSARVADEHAAEVDQLTKALAAATPAAPDPTTPAPAAPVVTAPAAPDPTTPAPAAPVVTAPPVQA